jgi:hypothetical protein
VESRGALFAVAIPLIAFKIWFAILLLSYVPNRGEGVAWIAVTHWPLLIVLVFLIGPGIAIARLLRARARRERLRRSEWMIETPAAIASRPQWSVWETVSRLEERD